MPSNDDFALGGKLADAILAAAQLHTDSFDHRAAKASTGALAPGIVQTYYRMSLQDAANQVAPELAAVIVNLLSASWGSTLDWAAAAQTAARESAKSLAASLPQIAA